MGVKRVFELNAAEESHPLVQNTTCVGAAFWSIEASAGGDIENYSNNYSFNTDLLFAYVDSGEKCLIFDTSKK